MDFIRDVAKRGTQRACIALVFASLPLLGACSTSEAMTEQQVRTRCAEALVANAHDLGRGSRPELLSTDFDAQSNTWRCEFGRNGRMQVAVVLHARTGVFEISRG